MGEVTKPKWYEAEKDEVRGFYLNAPYDNIFVGCDPRDGMSKASADSFDVFMNVSDTACTTFEPSRPGQHMHWYPVNECGRWNLSFFFWLKTILDHHHAKRHRIYLHCHAGAYRSPSTALLWLRSNGHSPEQALSILKERGPGIYRIWGNLDNIPKLAFYVMQLMNEHPKWSLGSILHETRDYWNREIISGHSRTMGLLHRYFKPYYRVKWFVNGQIRTCKEWLKGEGWRPGESKGCTYRYTRKYFWAWAKNAEMQDEKESFIEMLQKAHAGEWAAYLAYEGHAKSLERRNPEKAAKIRVIQKEEWFHRQAVGFMLHELGARPNDVRDGLMGIIGRIASALCYVVPTSWADRGAMRIERIGKVEYHSMAYRAKRLGFPEMEAELQKMSAVEKSHEDLFVL